MSFLSLAARIAFDTGTTKTADSSKNRDMNIRPRRKIAEEFPPLGRLISIRAIAIASRTSIATVTRS